MKASHLAEAGDAYKPPSQTPPGRLGLAAIPWSGHRRRHRFLLFRLEHADLDCSDSDFRLAPKAAERTR